MGTKGKKLPSRTKYDMKDLVGKQFGDRIILGRAPNTKSNNHMILVQCVCGDIAQVETTRFLKGRHRRCIQCARRNQVGNKSSVWRGGKYISSTVYNSWRNSAKRRKLVWELSMDYVDSLIEKQNWRCSLTGESLFIGHGGNNKTIVNGNISLDRIDSSVGYIIGNVQLVAKPINMVKQTLTNEQFISLCRKVVAYADITQVIEELT